MLDQDVRVTAPLTLHPDRLLPADPGVRGPAAALYAPVAELPVISPHGHVQDHRWVVEIGGRSVA